MSRTPSPHPTDGELEILRILWQKGSASFGEVHDAVSQGRPVAKTTVATVLGVMLEKRLVKRTKGRQGYIWSARVDRDSAARGMIHKLTSALFEGSASRLVAHLVEGGELTDHERMEIRKLLESPPPGSRKGKPP